jgi:branched-chain amino acid transport system permease protein
VSPETQQLLQHLINGLSVGSLYALIALGYSMVYGILQLINFAHSEVYMVGAFSAFFAAKAMGLEAHPGLMTLALTLLIAMVTSAALGVTIERLAYRPLRSAPKLNILITAIGVSLFLQYSGQALFGADPKRFPQVLEDRALFEFGGVTINLFEVTILSTALVFMTGLHLFVQKTLAGKAMRAVSVNPLAASLMGIHTNRIVVLTFLIGSALAGVGAVLVGLKYPRIEPLMGLLVGMKAFVAAVLGGIGSLPGAVVGGLVLGLSEEMVAGYLSSTYRDAIAFAILVVILVFKPSGLLGANHQEKV